VVSFVRGADGLRADLLQVLQFEHLDLVAPNQAHPILRFETISGRPSFCRDPPRRAALVSLTVRKYEDEMAWVNRTS
jgi:hypothetical protein